MKLSGWLAVSTCLIALAPARLTEAAPVQFTLTGTIDSLIETGGMGFSGSIAPGTPFSISGSLDTSIPDTTTPTGTYGTYPVSPALGSLHVEVGGYVVDVGPTGYLVRTTVLVDYYQVEMFLQGIDPVLSGLPAPLGTVSLTAGFYLANVSSSPPPVVSDTLAGAIDFMMRDGYVRDVGTGYIDFHGDDYPSAHARASGWVRSVTVVPEPTLAALTLLPLLLLMARRALTGSGLL